MLKINVSTAEAVITETELITSGRKGLKCAFSFSSDWSGLQKIAVFQGVATRDIALLSGNEVVVPAECIAKAQFPLKIGVYGAKPDGTIAIPTIWANFGKVLPGTKPSAIPPDEITPDVVAQIEEAASNALYLARNVQSMADSGAFDGTDGVSPAVTIETITGGHSVTITDADHPSGQTFDVMDGEDATVDATLSNPGEAADAAETGEVRDALNRITETAIIYDQSIDAGDITRIQGKTVNTYGNLVSNDNYSCLWFVAPIDGYYKVTSSTSSQLVGRIYSSSNFSSSTLLRKASKNGAVLTAKMTAGEYFLACAWSTTFTITALYAEDETTTLKGTIPLTSAMQGQAYGYVDNKLTDIQKDDYEALGGTFERGGYLGYSSTDSRSYRVRRKEPLEFGRDVWLIADDGFYFAGYFSGGSELDTTSVYKLSAGTKLKIYIRRVTESASETADIDTFAAAVKVSTALAGIEEQPRYTDISIFERVGICGDSYAAGTINTDDTGGRPRLSWGAQLGRQAGVNVYLFAKSGVTPTGWLTDSDCLPKLLDSPKCGLYWIAHGINGSSNIGDPEDMDESPHPDTFYGGYAEGLDQILAYSPNSKIVLTTVIGSNYTGYQANDRYQNANEAIHNIGEHYNLPVIDITEDDFYKSLWYSDNIRGNHPVAMTYAGMAAANRRLLQKCIMDNPAYFRGWKGIGDEASTDIHGIPSGGTTGQVLKKASSTSYDATWANESGGGTSVEPYTSNPAALGTASPGSSDKYARGDHVHAKPTYSKSDVGLGNVDNVQQYSANNPPPYPVSSVNNQTGAVTLSIPSSASDVGAVASSQGVGHAGEFLVVGSDGNVTTVTLATWQGGNY